MPLRPTPHHCKPHRSLPTRRRKNLPAPGTDVLVLRCGPGPMNRAMEAHMDALGYTNGQQFQF